MSPACTGALVDEEPARRGSTDSQTLHLDRLLDLLADGRLLDVDQLAAHFREGRPVIVFGIGLNKTGTSSLHKALTIVGRRSLHWGGPKVRSRIEQACVEGRPPLDGLEKKFDAFSDILPIARNFATFDRAYPDSVFILTVRNVDDWLESRRRHVERNQAKAREGRYTGAFLEIDVDGWRTEWDAHLDSTREYFRGAKNYLEIDLTSSPQWQPICELLGLPIPDAAFPWENAFPGAAQ